MMIKKALLVPLALLPITAFAQSHFLLGQPSCDDLHQRIGYALRYNAACRIPDWVAYKIEPEFRKHSGSQWPI